MSNDNDGAEALGSCLGVVVGIAIILYIIYVIVCCILAVAGVVIFCGAALGLAWGAVRSTYNFVLAAKENLFYRDPARRIEDNCYVSFFHLRGDGFRNIGKVWANAFSRNWWDVSGVLPRGKALFFALPFRLVHIAVVLASTVIYLPILSITFTGIYLVIWFLYVSLACEMRFMEWCFNKIHGLFNICQHCHQRVDLPVYRCPGCGVEYSHLVPSVKFGPFFRKCRCGEYLPTSRFFERNALTAICPNNNCHQDLKSSDVVPVSIAMLGGGSVGKSHFMMDAVYLLQENVLPEMKRSCQVAEEDQAVVENLCRYYEAGIRPDTTRDGMIEAICLETKAKTWAFPQRLYLYDPPGESFKESDKISSHRYYRNMQGAVLIIDPFTLTAVLSDYRQHGIQHTMLAVGAMAPEESISRWLISMERDFPGIAKRSCLAVCINKTDESSFQKITGLTAGDRGKKCRQFLERYECINLVNKVEMNFHKVEYFAVSATGSGGDGKAFQPEGISDVLKWLLSNI